jgi:hypothetical protein
MQSATPPLDEPSWKNPRFFIWLFAIGAIIYNSIKYANYATIGDFFGYFIYYVVFTLWYKFSYKYTFDPGLDTDNGKNGLMTIINGFLTFFIFAGAMWVIGDMAGVFVIIPLLIGLTGAAIYGYYVRSKFQNAATGGDLFNLYKSVVSMLLNFDYAALSVFFPISMLYYKIITTNATYNADVKDAKTQIVNDKEIPSPLGEQIVYGIALSILILTLVMYWWKFRTTVQLDKPINLSVEDKSSWWNLKNIFPLDFLKAFPIFEYARYVATNDLAELARKVSMVGLLAYVGYLIYGVYIQKKPFIPCTESSFSSCFNTPFPIGNDIPYVNLLFWVLVLCSVVNVVNWIISFVSNYKQPSAPSMVSLMQLLLFPFYWFITLVARYPIASVISFFVFAALGLFLYKSSFDLNDFVQGQKGTVATLLTMFIVSLLIFGVYSMNSSTADMVQGETTYGQFIGKTGMGFAVMICLLGIVLYFLNSHSKLVTLVSVIQFGINALIYIAGIALLVAAVRTLFSTSRKMGGSIFQVSRDPDSNWVINMLKLFANLLFYLPCLMLDFVDMMKEQYGLTTRPILLLLAAEAAFILIGRFLPSFVAKAINHTGVQILSAPISMTTSVPITTYDIQFVNAQGVNVIPTSTNSTMVRLKNFNYGVSAWFYIHPQPPNTNANYLEGHMNLMRFGDFGPSVQFSPKTNTLQFTLYGKSIELTPNEPLTVSDVPLQTWNNIIINSDKGVVDIVINNKLVYTGTHIPDNSSAAIFNVELGQADGVHGEICNVVLNTEPFTKPEIMWLYKTNKVLNPPVVGVNMDQENQGQSASYLADEAVDKNAPKPTQMPSISTRGAQTYGILGAVLGAIFGWLFNDETAMESTKGFVLGAIVFGLIGALLGALFSTDGTVAYILKTVANVFVDTF